MRQRILRFLRSLQFQLFLWAVLPPLHYHPDRQHREDIR